MTYAQTLGLSPVFVVGYVHTGTTLLRSVLGRHSSLFMMYGESHFFEDLERIRRTFPNLADDATLRAYVRFIATLAKFGSKRAAYKLHDYTLTDLGLSQEQFASIVDAARTATNESPRTCHVAAFRSSMNQLTQLSQKTRWVEKTPAHVHCIREIIAAMTDARIVELVRDPRAALASRKARAKVQWREAKLASGAIVNQRIIFDPVLDSYIWRSAVHAGARATRDFPGSVLRVRYEDLVAQPSQTIKTICEFIGIEFKSQMLQVGWVNSTTYNAHDGFAGIGQGALEKWRETLSNDDIVVIQAVLRKEMAALGYQPVTVDWRAVLMTPLTLCRSAVRLARRFSSRRVPAFEHRWHNRMRSMRRHLFGRPG